ncbi:PREDICTED: uncharacterized protein LOC109469036 [Branchiostoma belcheri]|uniref:Uncharacterized protein LOC109469036 n=1 Tax=Branchiostoma belcheri TaxID=7741 RepID=A0A6P4YMT0_BRABE|nr:PREDICTED: uncharacterized protein LOC109469036 [Branchiostoma belcheri]
MGRKLRHVLIFLLIILKEPNTPEADCRCAPSSDCRCTGMGLISIPQNLPTSISGLDLTFNLITTVNRSLLLRYGGLTKLSLYNNKITIEIASGDDHQYEDIDNHRAKTGQGQSQANKQSPTIAKLSRNKVLAVLKPNPTYTDVKTPPKDPTSESTAKITATVMASCDDHHYEDVDNHRVKTQGRSQAIATPKTKTKASVLTSGDDHQYEDIDNHRVKTGQGQSQANSQPPTIAKLLRNKVLAVLKPNPTYTDVKTPPKDPTSESTAKITATVMASGDDHHYEDVDDNHRSKQGRSQAKFGKSNTKNTASVMTSGDDHHYEDVDNHRVKTGQSQSQAIAKSNTKTTAVVMTRSDVEAGQGQCQAITESLAAKNLSYGTGPTASRLSPVYTTATHDQ